MVFPGDSSRSPQDVGPGVGIRRTGRWLAIVVMFAALGFAGWHAFSVSRYLARVDRERFQEKPAEVAGREITLGIAQDGITWIRLTEARVAAGRWRLAATDSDGPGGGGRAVFWSSGWSLWLEFLGRVRAWLTDESPGEALRRAALWSQLPLWTLAVALGGWAAARRWGWWACAVLVAGMAGHRGFYVAFYPAYPDHHGLAAVASLGMFLGLSVAGWGGDGMGRARLATTFSALSGACGLAISAASIAPAIAVACAAAFVVRGLVRRHGGDEGLRRGARLWRWWAAVGATFALGLYLLEYCPDRLGWRLEANHPLHALAWWGAGELLAWWWRRGAESAGAGERFPPVLAVIASLSPLAAVLAGGSEVFVLDDGFLRAVHGHIDEFKAVWNVPGSVRWLFLLSLTPLALVPLAWRRADAGERVSLAALATAAGALSLLAAVQHRWWSTAAGALLVLAAVVACVCAGKTRGGRCGWPVALLVLAWIPGPWLLASEQLRVARAGDVQAGEAMQLLYRDIAWTLRAANPGKKLVLLAPPDASVAAGYHGDMRSIGTLYWENRDGLLATARLFGASDDDEAAETLSALGVTHLLLVRPGDFLAAYRDALVAAGEKAAPAEKSLGERLLAGRAVPVWARAVPYAVPSQFARLGVAARLYAFSPGLGFADSRRALGVALLAAGDEKGGRAALREAVEAGSPEAALLLAWRRLSWPEPAMKEPDDTIALAEMAVRARPDSPAYRRVLAAAYAASGRWPEAQGAILRAVDLALEAGDRALAAELEREFARYRDRAGNPGN